MSLFSCLHFENGYKYQIIMIIDNIIDIEKCQDVIYKENKNRYSENFYFLV